MQSAASEPRRASHSARGSSTGTRPVASAKIVSPSKGVCAGRIARANPSFAISAIRCTCAADSRAFVATTPIVVAWPGGVEVAVCADSQPFGGRRVEARAIDDAAFVAGLVGDSGANDHLRYGAELLASFGRAIREGYLDVQSDAVFKLTEHRARTLGEVLASHLG